MGPSSQTDLAFDSKERALLEGYARYTTAFGDR